jgi:hypothetical protein
MNLDELSELTANPNFIEGIYNYCDRWCERCPLTQRCANFAPKRAQAPDGEIDDLNGDELWEKLNATFQNTLAFLHEVVAEQGIDLDDPALAALLDHDEALRAQAEAHPCAEQAFAYMKLGYEWFAATADRFAAKKEDLIMLARLTAAEIKIEQQAIAIGDAVEVIQWDLDFIAVKLQRALQGQLEEAEDPDAGMAHPENSDGSAKVALLAIDRSIEAWRQLLRHFPERETAILELLAHLARLRRAVEQQFPAARAFIRPGFDTGDLPPTVSTT